MHQRHRALRITANGGTITRVVVAAGAGEIRPEEERKHQTMVGKAWCAAVTQQISEFQISALLKRLNYLCTSKMVLVGLGEPRCASEGSWLVLLAALGLAAKELLDQFGGWMENGPTL